MSNGMTQAIGGIAILAGIGVGGYFLYKYMTEQGGCQEGATKCDAGVSKICQNGSWINGGSACGDGGSCIGVDCPAYCDGTTLYYAGSCNPNTGLCEYNISTNDPNCVQSYPFQIRLTDNGVADPKVITFQSTSSLYCWDLAKRAVEDTHEIQILVVDNMQRPRPNIDVQCTIDIASGWRLLAWLTGAPTQGYPGSTLNCDTVIATTDNHGIATVYATNIKNPSGSQPGYMNFWAKDPRGNPPTYPGAYLQQSILLSRGTASGNMLGGPNTCIEHNLPVAGGCWS